MTAVSGEEVVHIQNESDLVTVRYQVRAQARAAGLGLVDETKLVTAVSELARNCLVYGGGGKARLGLAHGQDRKGVQVVIEDQGPGIVDVARAMENGFSTGSGLGLGLPGSRRLVHEFDLKTELGKGTSIKIIRWKS